MTLASTAVFLAQDYANTIPYFVAGLKVRPLFLAALSFVVFAALVAAKAGGPAPYDPLIGADVGLGWTTVRRVVERH